MANGGKQFVPAPSIDQWFALFKDRSGMEFRAIPVVGWVQTPSVHGDAIIEGYVSAPPQAPDEVLIPARAMSHRLWENYNHDLVGYRTHQELQTLSVATGLPLNYGWVGEDFNEAMWPEALSREYAQVEDAQ